MRIYRFEHDGVAIYIAAPHSYHAWDIFLKTFPFIPYCPPVDVVV